MRLAYPLNLVVAGLAAATVALVSYATPVAASIDLDDSRLRTHQVDVQYVEPKNASHSELYAALRKMRVLEQLEEFLSPVRLPRRIMIRTEGCDGKARSSFDIDTITVCYEYFDVILKHLPKIEREGLTAQDALVGPTVDIFLHEFGHALPRLPGCQDRTFQAGQRCPDSAGSREINALTSQAGDDIEGDSRISHHVVMAGQSAKRVFTRKTRPSTSFLFFNALSNPCCN